MIKEEAQSESNHSSAIVHQIRDKQVSREGLDVANQNLNEEIQLVPPMLAQKDMTGRFSSSFDDFKKLMLACMWGKRLTKNEILMMNLIQNIEMLNQAVSSEEIPLKQALMILEGLQKVYTRKMLYLFDDSKYILNQLESPFKMDADYQVKESSGEVDKIKTTNKRKKEDPAAKGFQAHTLKLDLKNSKWWNVGFNTSVL